MPQILRHFVMADTHVTEHGREGVIPPEDTTQWDLLAHLGDTEVKLSC